MSVTANTILDGNFPKDPWGFGRSVECIQPRNLEGNHKILFNKGRYFETSIYDSSVRENVSQLTGIPVQYNTMIVGSWNKLEDFVIAMNIQGVYVNIDIDWI